MLEFKKDGLKAAIFLAPSMLLMLVFTFWPIINAVIMAFLEDYSYLGTKAIDPVTGEFMKDPNRYDYFISGDFAGIGFKNFVTVLTDPLFWTAVRNTALMVIISVPVTVLLGLAIAVGMNSIKKLQGVYQIVFFLPYVTNTIALGLVFRSIFHVDTGLINELFDLSYAWVHVGNTFWRAFFVLMVYTVWDGLAFKIIVFLSGLQSIDKQYYQAAQIDATPKGRVFSKITVPLLSPMILYITITSFIGAFKAYSSVIAIFETGGFGPKGDEKQLYTIVGYIYDVIGGTDGNTTYPFGKGAAASIILFAIIMLITLVQFQVSKKRVHY